MSKEGRDAPDIPNDPGMTALAVWLTAKVAVGVGRACQNGSA
jgi:hypothetical protein